jgi:two-component system chemotaxis sensor kinase CheA
MAVKNSENIQTYVDESLEHLADIESDLLQIEKSGAEIDEELVNKVFRTAHSIKGGAGFLGFTNIKELAHKMENILGMIRNRKLLPDSSIVNILLKAGDTLNVMIDDVGESNSVDAGELLEQLVALAEGTPVSETGGKAPKIEKREAVTVSTVKTAKKISPEKARQTEFEQIVRTADVSEGNIEQEIQEEPARIQKKQVASFETSLRVNINLLDTLMTLAGELVLSRNQLLEALSEKDNDAVESVGQRIDLITSDLQESIMLTRMQPIGKIFKRFPRQVRDQARSLGKDVALTIEGEDVEVDKTIVEAINNPLTHLVRNAIDHGIELPEMRHEQGKAPVGKVVLRAFNCLRQAHPNKYRIKILFQDMSQVNICVQYCIRFNTKTLGRHIIKYCCDFIFQSNILPVRRYHTVNHSAKVFVFIK